MRKPEPKLTRKRDAAPVQNDWEYRRGDIYLANLNPVVGSEIGGIRPVLVLQNNTGNHYGPTIITAPMTSKIKRKPGQPTHFLLENVRGLKYPSMVMLEQIRTLDKRRVIKYMGTVSQDVMDSPEFRSCLAVSVALFAENEKHPDGVRKGADNDIGRNEKFGCENR